MKDTNLVLANAAVITATGQQSGVSLRLPSSTALTNAGGTPPRGLTAHVSCSPVSGTTPTAVFSIQHSDDNSTYATIATQNTAALAAAGDAYISFETDKPWVRLSYVITGTTPSFTTSAWVEIARP